MNWCLRDTELYYTDTLISYEKVIVNPISQGIHQSQKKYFKSNEQHFEAQEEKTVEKVTRIDYHVGIVDLFSQKEIKAIKIRTDSGWLGITFANPVTYEQYADPIDLIRESQDVYKVIQVFEGQHETKELYDFYNQVFSANFNVHFAFAPCCASEDDYCCIIVAKKGLKLEL